MSNTQTIHQSCNFSEQLITAIIPKMHTIAASDGIQKRNKLRLPPKKEKK